MVKGNSNGKMAANTKVPGSKASKVDKAGTNQIMEVPDVLEIGLMANVSNGSIRKVLSMSEIFTIFTSIQ